MAHLPSLYYQQLVTLMFAPDCDPSPGAAAGNDHLFLYLPLRPLQRKEVAGGGIAHGG